MDFAMTITRQIFTLLPVLLSSILAAAPVDRDRLVGADAEPGNWLSHGRTYAEQRHSPLARIKPGNVSQLGLAWYFDTGTRRGLEASPLVIDGVMFSTGSWSRVYAHDAVSGELLWSHDPQVPRAWGANACCDVVNRGVAAWGERVFVGTLDGRLVALDRDTGRVAWETLTIDTDKPYTITGAPRVANGKVFIGNGGAELGVRGYVSAYSADDGRLLWRFYTVPGNPDDGYESEALKKAASTWNGDVYWQVGGGGTVWDSMAYDPALNLLYFGVGNGSPWNRHVRSPGGGDNLYLSSIVAVDADSGEYAWHYQTTPGDSWDYTATQHIILADLEIDGRSRKVLMQAPKNGFFYVLDRATGELLSASNYVPVTWASGVDLETGRPVETDNADHLSKDQWTRPGPLGGHNWHPMAYNPDVGLVFIPAQESRALYSTPEKFQYHEGPHWNLGQKTVDEELAGEERMPPELAVQLMPQVYGGHLLAWDPVAQQERWRVEHATLGNGGVLSTASGLVFQGTGDGRFVAYDASYGELLWEFETGTGTVAAPVTYQVDGVQYVAVMAGWGGAAGLLNFSGDSAAGTGRLLVFALGGKQALPSDPAVDEMLKPPAKRGSEASVARGLLLYDAHCAVCHGIQVEGGTIISDLRSMPTATHASFKRIVLGGMLESAGMKSFAGVLTEQDVSDLQDYLIEAAHLMWDAERNPDPRQPALDRQNEIEAARWLRDNSPSLPDER
jgi:quinohemoprotein ethanol dehydrogenase